MSLNNLPTAASLKYFLLIILVVWTDHPIHATFLWNEIYSLLSLRSISPKFMCGWHCPIISAPLALELIYQVTSPDPRSHPSSKYTFHSAISVFPHHSQTQVLSILYRRNNWKWSQVYSLLYWIYLERPWVFCKAKVSWSWFF